MKMNERKKETDILCIKEKASQFACLNKKCEKYVFMCADKACECRKDHPNCVKAETQNLVTNVFKKIRSTKKLEDHISAVIDKTIDNLSDLRDKLLHQINQKFKYMGLNKQQLAFVQAIEKDNFGGMKGRDIIDIIYNLSHQSTISNQIINFEKRINQKWNEFQSVICKVQENMLKQFQYIEKSMCQKSNYNNNQLFKDSKIVKTQQNVINLKGFFQKKNIKSSKLVYRASQNGFGAKEFHQKCANIPHTVTLVETQFGKIIGGYTPIIWNKVYNGEVKSSQKKSFMFSLTNNQKLTINPNSNQTTQIACYDSYGPIYGVSRDLIIFDKSNQQSNSYANVGKTYTHQNYTINDRQSWKRFSGGDGSKNFKTKQWQVWQVQFQQK